MAWGAYLRLLAPWTL